MDTETGLSNINLIFLVFVLLKGIEKSLHGLNSTDLYLKYEIEFSTSKSAL
jgi:hypothetical protein